MEYLLASKDKRLDEAIKETVCMLMIIIPLLIKFLDIRNKIDKDICLLKLKLHRALPNTTLATLNLSKKLKMIP